MQRERGQSATMRGDPVRSVERPQQAQQSLRLGIAARIGWGEERQLVGRGPPERQFQHKRGQVRRLYLGRRVGGERAFPALGPEPVAQAGRNTACTACPLCRLGPRDAFGDQPRHPRAGIEPCAARTARIDDNADILDGERGLRDRGGQNDLAFLTRCNRRDGRALGSKIHRPEQRADSAISGQVTGQKPRDTPDLALSGQEYQNTAVGFGHSAQHQIGAGLLQPCGFGQGGVQPAQIHGIAAPFRGDDRDLVTHQGRHRGSVQRGGHRQQDQVVTQRIRDFQTQGQTQIGIERALVEFVKDNGPHARQFRV